MQSVKFSELEKFTDDLEELLKKIPGARRKLHEEMAALLKKEVDTQIVASGIRDNSGKVRGWQQEHVGSGGGYAAIRPIDSSTGANSPGAITNYLESGHKIRPPSGKAKRYKPKIKVPYVEGRHFYQRARKTVEAKVMQMAERFAEDLSRSIEG